MDGSYDVYTVAVLPDKRINITGETISFECDIDKVTLLGVVMETKKVVLLRDM
ncbi:hypothetical protein DUT67_05610 [Pectobacterium peruviense]|uniref:hypothetical protein n=1 Tax=Pectobacterium peruviense TaxID=2066479 RepID=UPI0034A24E22